MCTVSTKENQTRGRPRVFRKAPQGKRIVDVLLLLFRGRRPWVLSLSISLSHTTLTCLPSEISAAIANGERAWILLLWWNELWPRFHILPHPVASWEGPLAAGKSRRGAARPLQASGSVESRGEVEKKAKDSRSLRRQRQRDRGRECPRKLPLATFLPTSAFTVFLGQVYCLHVLSHP
jgi:hypothetical protein